MTVPRVGVDVVDLSDPRTADRHGDRRFVRRVLAEAERAFLASSADPGLELWGLWAAKEAAYKVASKLREEPPVFVHAAFAVAWEGGDLSDRRGVVRYGELALPVRGWWEAGTVRVVAASTGAAAVPEGFLEPVGEEPLEALLARLTPREADAVHSVASARVRLAARSTLARALSVEERRLEIVCDPGVTGRRPPRVHLDGAPAPADVSLSHHGRWVAWALLRTPSGGS